MKGFTIFIILVAIVIVGFLVLRKPAATPMTETTPDQTSDAAGGTQLSDISTRDENVSGTKEFDVTASSATWTGSKTLIKDYYDIGTIKIKSGNALFTKGVLTGGTVVFDMNSIATLSTGNGSTDANSNSKQAEHMKSSDFFDAAKYPEAKFVITSVSHEAGDTYMLTGDLTIKGSAHPTTFPVEVVTADGKVTIEGTATIDRTVWDIKYGSGKFFPDLGDKVIGDEFTLAFKAVTK